MGVTSGDRRWRNSCWARQDVELKIVRNNIVIDQGEDKLLQILTDMPVWHFGLSKEVRE